MNHIIEEQLLLHYYGEADDGPSIERHLASCESCLATFRELQRVLSLMSSMPVPERSRDYGETVWKRIKPHLGLRLYLGRLAPFRLPGWVMAAAMASLLVAAFLVGRYWSRPEPPVLQELASTEAGRRILVASAVDHLERSQVVLLDLSHAGGSGHIDISIEQAWARELLESNRIYRQAAERMGEAGLASVLDDLERTLLEIAHSPSRIASSQLSEMQRQIESGGILFKLRVAGSRMRERENATARELSRSAS